MVDKARAARMADRIKVVVAQAIEQRIKDPRLGFVTITDCRVTGDLQHASIFYTVMGDEQQHADTAEALASATGMLRSEVGQNLSVRLTPTLEFIVDTVPENVGKIEELLATAADRDAQIAAQASTAHYAGDADPYRKPSLDDDTEDEPDEPSTQAHPYPSSDSVSS